MKNPPEYISMVLAALVTLIELFLIGSCRGREDTVATTVDLTQSIAPMVEGPNSAVSPDSAPAPIPSPVSASEPTDGCEQSSFKCPPTVRPMKCVASEVNGEKTYAIDSAPSHCAGILRLYAMICADHLKFSDFTTQCTAKSE